jgi:hypothetical protein
MNTAPAPLKPRPRLFWSLLALYALALGALIWMRLAR